MSISIVQQVLNLINIFRLAFYYKNLMTFILNSIKIVIFK